MPDVVHTSVLRRAIATANLALDAPIATGSRQAELAPQRASLRRPPGKNKKETLDQYARSSSCFGAAPTTCRHPPSQTTALLQAGDIRYAASRSEERMPQGRLARALPYWHSDIVPTSRPGRSCLLPRTETRSARSSSTSTTSTTRRSSASTSDGIPLKYELDEDLKPSSRAGSTSTQRPRPRV